MNRPRTTVILRWVAAASVFGGGAFLLIRVMTGGEYNWMAIFGKSLFGLAGLMAGVILIAPEVVC